MNQNDDETEFIACQTKRNCFKLYNERKAKERRKLFLSYSEVESKRL